MFRNILLNVALNQIAGKLVRNMSFMTLPSNVCNLMKFILKAYYVIFSFLRKIYNPVFAVLISIAANVNFVAVLCNSG